MLAMFGNLTGLIGVLLCAGSGGARLAGLFHVAGFEAMTLFIGGMALMLFSALLKLEVLSARLRSRF